MSKYERLINIMARSDDNNEVEFLFAFLWNNYDNLSEVEKEVVDAWRYRIHGRRFENYLPLHGPDYEGMILARQESDYD